MSVVTIQTTTTNTIENKTALDYLSEYGVIFGQATRTGFSRRNRIGKTQIKESELDSSICKELEKRFGISNSEAKTLTTRQMHYTSLSPS